MNLNDNVQRQFYYTGWYERAFLEFLRDELRADDTYVDVGAHVGIDAAFAADRAPNGKVVAFEPAPDTVALLDRSVGRLENVDLVPAALGNAAGTVTLRANPKWHPEDAATRSRFGAGPPVCEAPVLRFDDWATGFGSMDVVKIDVEGDELEVLKGMSDSLRRLQPRVVAVEIYEPYLAAAGVTEAEIVEFLAELGYRRERRIGDNVIFRHRASETAPALGALQHRRNTGRSLKPVLYPAAAAVALAAWCAKTASFGAYNVVWEPFGMRLGEWTLLFPVCVVVTWISAFAVMATGRGAWARAVAGFFSDVIVLAGRLLRDSRVPLRRKLLLALLIVYFAMPLDPLPDFIPVIGQLDEALVLAFVLRRLARGGGESLIRQHWPGPDSSLQLVLRLAGSQ